MTQTKSKQTDLNDIVGDTSDNEGAIQEVFGFNTELQILGGEIKEGKKGKYALITVLEDIVEHKVRSSAAAIIETIEELIRKDSFNGKDTIACMVKKNTSSNDYVFFTLVGLKE